MTKIADGSTEDYGGYKYKKGMKDIILYAWGWLGSGFESQQKSPGELKSLVLKILDANEKRIDVTRGFHTCEMCGESNFNGTVKIAHNGKLYAAPWGVQHYIKEHDYWPEEEVVQAILHGNFCDEDDLYPAWD